MELGFKIIINIMSKSINVIIVFIFLTSCSRIYNLYPLGTECDSFPTLAFSDSILNQCKTHYELRIKPINSDEIDSLKYGDNFVWYKATNISTIYTLPGMKYSKLILYNRSYDTTDCKKRDFVLINNYQPPHNIYNDNPSDKDYFFTNKTNLEAYRTKQKKKVKFDSRKCVGKRVKINTFVYKGVYEFSETKKWIKAYYHDKATLEDGDPRNFRMKYNFEKDIYIYRNDTIITSQNEYSVINTDRKKLFDKVEIEKSNSKYSGFLYFLLKEKKKAKNGILHVIYFEIDNDQLIFKGLFIEKQYNSNYEPAKEEIEPDEFKFNYYDLSKLLSIDLKFNHTH